MMDSCQAKSRDMYDDHHHHHHHPPKTHTNPCHHHHHYHPKTHTIHAIIIIQNKTQIHADVNGVDELGCREMRGSPWLLNPAYPPKHNTNSCRYQRCR